MPLGPSARDPLFKPVFEQSVAPEVASPGGALVQFDPLRAQLFPAEAALSLAPGRAGVLKPGSSCCGETSGGAAAPARGGGWVRHPTHSGGGCRNSLHSVTAGRLCALGDWLALSEPHSLTHPAGLSCGPPEPPWAQRGLGKRPLRLFSARLAGSVLEAGARPLPPLSPHHCSSSHPATRLSL